MEDTKPDRKPRFAPGTQFKLQGKKHATVHTVVDVLTTRNLAGEVVSVRYMATHQFMGQTISDSNVLETTIARGLVEPASDSLSPPPA